jgi:hypothetical protein
VLRYAQDTNGDPTLDVLTERYEWTMPKPTLVSLTGPPWRQCPEATNTVESSGTAQPSTCSLKISAQVQLLLRPDSGRSSPSGSANRSSSLESVRYMSVTIVVQRRLLTEDDR